MEPVDLEKLIGELEIALDRLRSLYDQYFVGLEKIVPAVLRKDVDRRFYLLRREQIRNTALRFRFQMVLQRYNTYQTYWQRICREIENGTYKRHLIRAQRRFGSTRPGPDSVLPAPAPDHPAPAAPGVSHDLVAQLVGLDKDVAPPSFEVDIQMDEEGPIAGVPPPQRLPATPAGLPAPAASKAAPAVWKKMPPAQGAPSASAAGPAAAAVPTRSSLSAPAPSAVRAPVPAPSAVRAPAPAPPPSAVRVPAPAPSAVRARPPASPLAGGPAPPLGGVPVTTPSRAPAPATTAAPSPAAPPVPANRAPAAPPRPASPPRPTPSLAAPMMTPPADLPEERLRAIYAEYVGAKRSQNESTAAITYQAVARSLRESGDKLRKKHGKAVDFEVAIKDGKTILRPVLK